MDSDIEPTLEEVTAITSIYATQRLSLSHVPADAKVCMSTTQRMYSILQGLETTEGEDDEDRTDKDGNTIKGEDTKSILSAFRNDYHPRIAVTVEMIATGTDIRPSNGCSSCAT